MKKIILLILISLLNIFIVSIKAEPKTEQKVMKNKTEEKVEPKIKEQTQAEKSDGIINKFVTWLLALFKK